DLEVLWFAPRRRCYCCSGLAAPGSHLLHSRSPGTNGVTAPLARLHGVHDLNTRTQDASGSSRQQQIQLAEYRQRVAEDKRQKQQEQMERHRKAARKIDVISPIQMVTKLDFRTSWAVGLSGYLTVPEIMKQLKWHKIHGVKEAITTVESKKFVDARASIVLSEGPREEEEDPKVTVQDLNDFDSDGYDSEEDYYK
ncbi:hypothetical protein EV359DRAFT_86306, partial [Lentinula novae-zelandiae]